MLLLTSHGTFSYGGCGGCVTFVYAELEQVLCGCCFAVVGFQVVACSSSRNGYISNPFPGCLLGTRTSILIFVMSCNVILCHPESARNPSLIHAVLVK